MNPRDENIAALLPWYLNGTLEEAERREVESWLRDRHGAEEELALWRSVQQVVRSEESAKPGSELGWRRLRSQISRAPRRPWWMAAAAASVLMVIGLQTAILLRDEPGIFRPLAAPESKTSWRFHVRFSATATMGQLEQVLLRNQAMIVEGPSALGLYTVEVARDVGGNQSQMLAKLRAEPLIEQVTP